MIGRGRAVPAAGCAGRVFLPGWSSSMPRATCRTSSSITGRTCGFCCRRCRWSVIMVVAAVNAICRRASSFSVPGRCCVMLTLVLAVLWVREAQRPAGVPPAGGSRPASSAGGTFVDQHLSAQCARDHERRKVAASGFIPAGKRGMGSAGSGPARARRSGFVRSRGFEPYLLFERREEPLFPASLRGAERRRAAGLASGGGGGLTGARVPTRRSRSLPARHPAADRVFPVTASVLTAKNVK